VAAQTDTAATAAPERHPGRRLPRTTGALSGLIIIVLGAWGALIPFVGPYFHYAFGNYSSWHFTGNRLLLDVLPGVVAVLGGFLLLTSSRRASGVLGGWLAVAAGGWFVVGPVLSLLWHNAGNPIGAPTGGPVRQTFEWLGYFFGIGAIIATLGAFATGRFVSRPRLVDDAAIAVGAAADGVVEHRRRRRPGRQTVD
jgi:hypothetical protein